MDQEGNRVSSISDAEPSVSASGVMIVDDVRIARESLKAQLAPRYGDIRCAWDLPSLLMELGDGTPSLILLNIRTPDSADVIKVAEDFAPRPKVVVYGLRDDNEDDVISCAKAGAAGLHLKSESFEHLLELVRDIEDGHPSCSHKVLAVLLGRIRGTTNADPDPVNGSLTEREAEILSLMREGLTNKQIANRLYISVHTVKNHVHNLLVKLGAQSRAEAAYIHSKSASYAS